MTPGLLHHGQLLSAGSAAEHESNLVLFIRHRQAAERFSRQLWDQKESLAALVRSHLRLRKGDGCIVLPRDAWIQGGFNLCVLVEVTVSGSSTKLVFRCPMPHKLAERQYPGTIDEKVRCEVAVYVWMQEHCCDVRIPSLHAFGFADGSQVRLPWPAPLCLLLCLLTGYPVYPYRSGTILCAYLPIPSAMDAPTPRLATPLKLLSEDISTSRGHCVHASRIHRPADRKNAFPNMG